MSITLLTGMPTVVYLGLNPKGPAVIFLHGQSEKGNGTEDGTKNLQSFIENPDNSIKKALDTVFGGESFTLIAPQLIMSDPAWKSEYIDKAYEFAIKLTEVDPSRIALYGVSLGAKGVLEYLSIPDKAQRFSVAVPVCPAWSTYNANVIADSGLPLWFHHAEDDDVCPVSITHDAVNAINLHNPKIKVHKTIYPTPSYAKHYIWGRAFDPTQNPGVWQWTLLNTNTNHKPVPTTSTTTTMATLTANAGLDQTITGTTATLDGSASTGFKNAWWTYEGFNGKWSGANHFDGSNFGIKVKLKDLIAGDHGFRLHISDGVNTVTDTVKITVQAAVVTPTPTTRQLLGTVDIYLNNGKLEIVAK